MEEIIQHISQLFDELYFSCSNAADVHLKGRQREAARKIAYALSKLEQDPDVSSLLNGDSED